MSSKNNNNSSSRAIASRDVTAISPAVLASEFDIESAQRANNNDATSTATAAATAAATNMSSN